MMQHLDWQAVEDSNVCATVLLHTEQGPMIKMIAP